MNDMITTETLFDIFYLEPDQVYRFTTDDRLLFKLIHNIDINGLNDTNPFIHTNKEYIEDINGFKTLLKLLKLLLNNTDDQPTQYRAIQYFINIVEIKYEDTYDKEEVFSCFDSLSLGVFNEWDQIR